MVTLALLGALSQQTPPMTPKERLAAMHNVYAKATSAEGTVTLIASDGHGKATQETHFAFDDKSRIFLRQQGVDSLRFLVSNGTAFVYSRPETLTDPNSRPLAEPVEQNGKKLTAREIYPIGAALLEDRSMVLDLIFGRAEDFDYRMAQLASVRDAGTDTLDGVEVHVLRGIWREYGNASPRGEYALSLTNEHQIHQMDFVETVVLPGGQQAVIHMQYKVKATLNKPVNEAAFKLPR